ncbi:MAG: Hsp20/alpha crystallin family protein [Desulfobulbaceae bacterium]|nr:Hsp20/alpha crystallin family protein [Desulfobulbaceae bacterium]
MNGWQDMDHFLSSMDLLRNRMNRIFNDLDNSEWLTAGSMVNYPRTNLYEMKDHFELQAEIPGLRKDDLNIRIQGNYLEISGKHRNETPTGFTAQSLERLDANFSRSFTLPVDIAQEKVEASLRNGILIMTLPKAETAKPRQINVK